MSETRGPEGAHARTDPEVLGQDRGDESVLSGRRVALGGDTVVDRVARHAAERAAAPAICGDGPTWSYAELWQHVARAAESLAEAGVEAGDPVAVWATRTGSVVATMLGAMALGAPYVPIDPAYPAARVRRILEVGKPKVLVCADPSALAASVPRGVLTLDTHAGPREPGALTPKASGEQVAYTVFTSGSTGQPKGVLVGHRALMNYLGWAREITEFEPEDATPCFASLGFDHSVTCLWLPLCSGGSVQLVPESWDPRPWMAPRERPFAFVKITPSHVRLFERIARPDYRRITRTVMFGGERLDSALVASLSDRLEGVRLLNHYGPTETTVGCSAHHFQVADLLASGAEDEVLPIGTPVWNSRAYVVDEDLHPVALGSPGELVVAGACVASGYIGGDASDQARFFSEDALGGSGRDRADEEPGAAGGATARAYRTGDRCVVDDGELRYLGRLDDQVKVRGFRIEIQEVRRVARSVEGVAEAEVVLSREGLGGLELFVVPEGDAEGSLVARVLERLRAELPSAAVPERVHLTRTLVANAHGKFDPEKTRAQMEDAKVEKDAKEAGR